MKDLEFLKNFNTYFVNEDKKDEKKGPKVAWFQGSARMEEIQKLSKEAYDYILEVTKILKTDAAYSQIPVIKMTFVKKAQLGLSEEEANKLVEEFQKDQDIKFGTDQFNTVYIDKQPFTKILEENAKLNNLYKGLTADLKKWSDDNASIFNFDNNVGDKVSNPDETNKALTALKDILVKYQAILKNVTLSLTGHTSTIAIKNDPEGNKKLSEQRANTVKNMLLAIYPEAKDFSIIAKGVGEANPLFADDKDDKEKQKKNRRVVAEISTDDASKPALPEQETTYNVIIYGFTLEEMDEQKKVTSYAPKKKGGFTPLNKKKLIPCPKFK